MRKINTLLLILLCNLTFSQGPTFQWVKTTNGAGTEVCWSIVTDASGNLYSTGWFDGTVDFDPGVGTFSLTSGGLSDLYLRKLDPSGNFVWAIRIGGTGNEYCQSLCIDGVGNVYMTGFFESTVDFNPSPTIDLMTSNGWSDIFITKFDPNGNLLWRKGMGGKGVDNGISIGINSSSDIVITGRFQDTVDFDPGPSTYTLTGGGNEDLFICRFTSSGNFSWAKTFGSSGNDRGNSIKISNSGDVYCTGAFEGTVDFDPGPSIFNLTSFGNKDIVIIKLNSTGNFLFAKQLGGSGYEWSSSIEVDGLGNIITTGNFSGIADFDPGASINNLSSIIGSDDSFICKLDPNGNYLFAKQFGGTGFEGGNFVVADVMNNLYSVGSFSGTVDFDPSASTFNITSGASDSYIMKWDPNGNFIWAESIICNDANWGVCMYLDGSSLYIGGYYRGTSDFDPTATTYTLSSIGQESYILKLNNTNAGIKYFTNEKDKIFYPNPSTGQFTFTNLLESTTIEITDLAGRAIFTSKNEEDKLTIDLSTKDKGVYFYRITDRDNKIQQGKLIIE